MKTLILVSMLLVSVGCSSPLEEANTCSERIGDYYSAGCKMYDGTSGYQYTSSEAVVICRKLVNIIMDKCSKCEDELANWLNCSSPSYNCGSCNDEYDRIFSCCAKNS